MEDKGITLPILDKMSRPNKVIGHVYFKNKTDLPDYPDFCLALGFNRAENFSYIPRVFVIVDDTTYLDAISKLNAPGAILMGKALETSAEVLRQKKDADSKPLDD